MAKYVKKSERKAGLWIAVLSCVAVLAILCVVIGYTGVADKILDVLASTQTTTTSAPSTQTTVPPTTTSPVPDPKPQFPEHMKGVWITAGVDYLTADSDKGETVKQQIDAAFAAVSDWEFNTVLLPLHKEEKAVYPSAVLERLTVNNRDGTTFDPVAYLVDLARQKGLYVYGVADLHVQDAVLGDVRNAEVFDRVMANVREQVSAYALDGYFISDFSYGIGQLKKDDMPAATVALDRLVEQAVAAIRKVNRDHYVGLLSTGIWAHASVDERGSDTGEYYEEMTDGCADTLAWVKEGLFDCVMVQGYTSTSHPTAPFEAILEWWGALVAEQQTPLYLSHSANTLGSYKVGWKLPDQLAQQYLYCKGQTSWKGSVYDTLSALTNDKTGNADTLRKIYAGTINEDFIYNTLTVGSPTKTAFTTTASTVKFEGGGDTNFPLTINGETVELTEHGFFTKVFSLKIGVNTFEFAHKGVTRTYKITYEQKLLESVSPAKAMTVEGGNVFIVSAVARKGSTVKATLGNQTIALQATPRKDDENTGVESDFESYSGSLTLPAGVIGKTQELGKVKVVATYNGLSETVSGGAITVEALPKPTTTTTTATTTTTTTTTTTATTATTTTARTTTGTTLPYGATVTDIEGNPVTNVSGEAVTIPTGAPVTDASGTTVTNIDGETMTLPVGVPATRPTGGYMTDPSGEIVTLPTGAPVTDGSGAYVTDDNGKIVTELTGTPVTDESGDYVTDASGVIVTEFTTTTTTIMTTATTTVATTTTTRVPYDPVLPAGNKSIVAIKSEYAETFNGGSATDDSSRPFNSYLPRGTWDYLERTVYNGDYTYYLLASGKRVYKKDATIIKGGSLSIQKLKDGSVHLTDSHTVFTFESDWYMPVYYAAYPQTYYGGVNYGIEKHGQTAEYVEVTFHYVSDVPAAPDLSNNPLFSKAEWKKGENNTYVLKLTLRNKGAYYGISYYWKDGQLVLSFLNPVDISKNSGSEKLKGLRILIDPGHGSPTDKPWEAPFNLDYANTLKEKLEALGATVDMTRTGPLTGELTLQERTAMANNGDYHLFISVHMNGANGIATGATVWYYYEQAYTASKYIYDEMHKAETPYGVGTTQNGTPRASGTNWSTLYLNRTIHDCPSVLLECAFLDNPKDKESLIDPLFRDKLMQAVTEGVIKYFTAQKK